MKLYANGCSFTWGGELVKNLYDSDRILLDENNNSELNKYRLNAVWPFHLSQLLNCDEHYNLSLGCGSNYRIVRKTLDFFLPKIKDKEDISDFIAVIQWTEPSRFEFYDIESNGWAIVKHDVVMFEKRHTQSDDIKYVEEYYKRYDSTVWGNHFFQHLLLLHSFFTQHNIKYMYTAYDESAFNDLTLEQRQYSRKNFVWYNNMNSCSINRMLQNTGHVFASGHPTEQGHIEVASNFNHFIRHNLV